MIRTQGLTKRYGAVHAVEDLALDVAEGDVYGFLGPNGSGKTTTVRMLLGLVLATSGSIEVMGRPMPEQGARRAARGGRARRGPRGVRRPVGAGEPRADGCDGAAPVSAPAGLAGSTTRSTRSGSAGSTSRPVRAYSLGMRQRLGLAAALLRYAAAARARRADQRAGPAGHPRDP